MGQYHVTVNLDKREFISPHKLASGLKLWEQLANEIGPGKALVILLAHPDKRGGGDFDITENWHGPERKNMSKEGPMPEEYPAIAARTIGRWRGDRIAIIGDYAEDGDLPNRKDTDPPESEIYGLCRDSGEEGEGERWTDVTDDVCAVIAHELQGAFVGKGWKHFYREGQEIARWRNQHPGDREKVSGKVEKITADKITVKFDGERAKTYKHDADIPFMF